MATKNKKEQTTIQLVINGKQAETTLKDVRAAVIAVERELSNMKKADDPAGYKKLTEQANKLRQAQAEMTAEIRGGAGSIQKLGNSWKGFAKGFLGGTALVAGLAALKQGFSELIPMVRKLSDELADIEKTTGLSNKAVRELNVDLQKIDTRTPTEELRRLASEAGRLGMQSKEEILEFVRAADQIQVALGDVLGEDATKDMAKIADIFKLKEVYGVEGALLRIGSAINEIGMASTANEGYVVDFIKRMSGISGIANISAQEVIAMAGTLDSLGQSSEVGSTALSKVLTKMGSDVPTYAKLAGKSIDEFRETLQRSAMEGLLMVLENVGQTTEGIEALSATLGDLGLDGGRVVGIFGSLAKNTDEYRRQLEIATKAMKEGTSVTNEFAVRNTNANAIIEKVWKNFVSWGERMALVLEGNIQTFGVLMGVVSEADIALAKMKEQEDAVAQAEKDLLPLISRYRELKEGVEKGTAAEADLKTVMNEIAAMVPQAVTEWGAYGEAIGLNIEKVNEFIAAQKSLLEYRRQERREALQQESEDIRRQASKISYEKNLGVRYQIVGTSLVEMRITDAEMRTLTKKEQELATRLSKIEKDLLALDGKLPDPGAPPSTGMAGTGGDKAGGEGSGKGGRGNKVGGGGNGSGDKKKQAYEQLLKDIDRAEQELYLSRLAADQREIESARLKYEKLREAAKGHSEEIQRINAMEVQELAQINQKYQKEFIREFDKSIRGQLERMNKMSKEKSDFERQQMDATLKAQDREADLVNRKYMELLVQYQEFGMDTANLYIQWAQELQAITEKSISATAKRLNAAIKQESKEKKEDTKEKESLARQEIAAYRSVGDAITGVLELTAANREENAKFEAEMAAFQVAIDSAIAIASAIKVGTSSSKTVWDMVASIAGAVAVVTTGMARAHKMMKEAKAPEKPAFRADGGPTDLRSIHMDKTGNPEGWVTQPTFYQLGRRSYVAGEAGAEYVVSNAMLRNPVVADFVGMLEALRQNRYFANGGSTAITGTFPGNSPVTVSTDPALLGAIIQQNKLLEKILAKPNGINYDTFERYKNRVDNIRHRASA